LTLVVAAILGLAAVFFTVNGALPASLANVGL
jgi:hypothetical protein